MQSTSIHTGLVNEDEASGKEYATSLIVGRVVARLADGRVPWGLAPGVECGPTLHEQRRDA